MATPRVTRSRAATPLPAISAKQSAAYGAEGKTSLRAQMRQGHQDVGDAFEAARQASTAPEPSVVPEEDDEEGESPPANERGRAGGSHQPSAAAPERKARKRAPTTGTTIPERTATALDSIARYGGERYGDGAEMYRPSNARDIPFMIFGFFFILFGVISFMTLWAYIPLPSALAATRDDLCHGLKLVFRIHPWEAPPAWLEATWYKFKHDQLFSKDLPSHNVPDLQWAININFLERIEKIEARLKLVEGDVASHQEAVTMIQEMLPSHVIVRIVDGKYEIPEAFWHALQERLGEESDMAPLWKSYIRRNEREIEELNMQLVSLSLDRAVDSKQILTKEQFTQEMAEQLNWVETRYQKVIREMQQEHFDNVKDVASRTASDVVANSPAGQFAKQQLHKLVAAIEVKNVYEALRMPNYFSIGLGARIDPYLTSATMKSKSKSWLESIYRLASPLVIAPRQPIVALQHWDEATECWCASVSDDGSTQITVKTGAKIYPYKLIVEHIPRLGTIDIMAAPHDIEIWAVTPSAKDAKRIADAIEDDGSKSYYFNQKCGTPPSPNHVCIGQGQYDIHLENWVQGLNVVNCEEMGVGVDKFTIKATTNWGGDHTCFYRLRMMGKNITMD